MKTVNRSTSMPIADLGRINPHIEQMNTEGWEILSVIQQDIGIHEYIVFFWKKVIP